MKINDYKNTDLLNKNPQVNKAMEIDGEKVQFRQSLENIQGSDRKASLENLLGKIEDAGKVLAKSRLISDLKNYKRAISNFLREANKKTYEKHEENSWDYFGNRKNYTVIKKIDSKLEELKKEVLEEQEENLKILDIIGEIKGILVDTYL